MKDLSEFWAAFPKVPETQRDIKLARAIRLFEPATSRSRFLCQSMEVPGIPSGEWITIGAPELRAYDHCDQTVFPLIRPALGGRDLFILKKEIDDQLGS